MLYYHSWVAIGIQHWITQGISVAVMAVGGCIITLVGSPPVSRKRASRGTIPPRAQVDQPRRAILQLAGKPERRHTAALGRAPRVVVDDAERRGAGVEGAAHAAQRILGVPGGGAAARSCSTWRSVLPIQ